MKRSKSLLDDFVKKDGPVATFGDNNKGKTKGFGTIQCNTMEFKNVSYVKGLRHNLISINHICDVGYKVHFNKEEANIFYSKKSIVLTANRENDIYVLELLFVLKYFPSL